MPNRRRFLQAAAALSATPGVAAANANSADAGRAIDLVVYEDAFPESRAFGRAALALGARVRRISADVTGLWSGELRELWRKGGTIAGMTTRQPLFCLEQLGWDAQMRVAFREAHPVDNDPDWPAYAAQALLTRPALDGPAPEMLSMADTLDDAPVLYSWIIAPAASRARTGSV